MDNLISTLLSSRLSSDFFARETTLVARELLGKLLVCNREKLLIGKIVETEAYRCDDPACHAFIGKTQRNSALFGPVGHAYVYLNYGLHYGFNVVAHASPHQAGGVLIRAVAPVYGTFTHQTNGPGKLTKALGINLHDNHRNLLTSSELFIAENRITPATNFTLQESGRIGISKAQEHPWRFFMQGNPYVSHLKKGN